MIVRELICTYPIECAHSITETEGFSIADGVAASVSKSVT